MDAEEKDIQLLLCARYSAYGIINLLNNSTGCCSFYLTDEETERQNSE